MDPTGERTLPKTCPESEATSYPRRNSSSRMRFVVSVTLCLASEEMFAEVISHKKQIYPNISHRINVWHVYLPTVYLPIHLP